LPRFREKIKRAGFSPAFFISRTRWLRHERRIYNKEHNAAAHKR